MRRQRKTEGKDRAVLFIRSRFDTAAVRQGDLVCNVQPEAKAGLRAALAS